MYHFFEQYEWVDIWKHIDEHEFVTYRFRFGGHTYTRTTLSETYDLIKKLQKGEYSK